MNIPGWMDEDELLWLADQASRAEWVVEIGSWMGRSTRALSDNTPGVVVAVDTWEGSLEHQPFLAGKPCNWLYCKFLENRGKNVLPMRMTSLQAAERSAPNLFDFLFLDASHDYESVKADIAAWRSKVRCGGVFAGHDYGRERKGVTAAVDEAFGSPQRGPGSIWWTTL